MRIETAHPGLTEDFLQWNAAAAKYCWNPLTSPCATLSADTEHKSQGHCWISHHKWKVVWPLYMSIAIKGLTSYLLWMLITIKKLSNGDVASGNVLGTLVLHQQKGRRGSGQVSKLGWDSMALQGLAFRKPLVGNGWAISLLLCTNGLLKVTSTKKNSAINWLTK